MLSMRLEFGTYMSFSMASKCLICLMVCASDRAALRLLALQVVASVSAEQKLSKPAQKGPLGLTLNHSDVFR